jgi:hypothetical protein
VRVLTTSTLDPRPSATSPGLPFRDGDPPIRDFFLKNRKAILLEAARNGLAAQFDPNGTLVRAEPAFAGAIARAKLCLQVHSLGLSEGSKGGR